MDTFVHFWGTVLAQQGQGAFSTGASSLPHLGTDSNHFLYILLSLPRIVIWLFAKGKRPTGIGSLCRSYLTATVYSYRTY